jgi:hypothetical protein
MNLLFIALSVVWGYLKKRLYHHADKGLECPHKA